MKKIIANLALSLASLVLTLLLILVIAFLLPSSKSNPHKVHDAIYVEPIHEPDPVLGHRLIAGISRELTYPGPPKLTISVKTNTLGFRDREYGTKDQNIFRILCLGDSYTFGDGVENDEPYPKVLERLLNQNSSIQKYEVINAGVNGYGTIQQFEVLKKYFKTLNPDLILLGFFAGNDVVDNLRSEGVIEKRFSNPFLVWLKEYLSFVRWIEQKWYLIKIKQKYKEGIEITLRSFEELDTFLKEKNTPWAALIIPGRPDDYEAYYKRNPLRLKLDQWLGFHSGMELETLRKYLRDKKVSFIDPYLAIQNYSNRDELYDPTTNHFSARGHELIAKLIYDSITKKTLSSKGFESG